MTERAASASGDAANAPSFEAAVQRVETIVDRLERGELALEEALALFEEGVRLSRRLAEQLAQAERRVELLVGEEGALETRPFEESEESA